MFLRLLAATAFLVTAGVTRSLFQHSIDTRYQILAFWVLAVAFEGLASASGRQFEALRLLLNGGAATVAIIAVRISLEGIPYKLTAVIALIKAG